jgi:DNA-directed RNA polymerase specialized sigma24 family protein
MQDREVVAAIVAGDPDGIAAAYDSYAASLFASCQRTLPDPADAADAVRSTFLIATSRLERLRDPDKLGSWLDAVARNECLRRRSAAGVKPGASSAFSPGVSSQAAAVDGDGDPAELRGQVLAACADSSPSGRADRVSAAHRAGAFSAAGFPRPFGSQGPQWWRRVRRHRRAAAAATALVAVAVAAGLATILTVGGSHRAHAATLALGGGAPGRSSGPASASPPGSPGSPTPSHRASSPAHPTPSVTAIGDVATPGLPPGQVTPSASASSSSASPSASSSPSPSPSPSPSSTSLPTEGSLSVSPDKLVLTATSGKAVTGTFLLSAFGGPVRNYTITVPSSMAGKVTVSPAKGSLSASGWVTVTVTVTSKIALNTQITVNPGAITVTVQLSIKA